MHIYLSRKQVNVLKGILQKEFARTQGINAIDEDFKNFYGYFLETEIKSILQKLEKSHPAEVVIK